VWAFTEDELRQEETKDMTDIAVERPSLRRRHPNASRALTHGSGLGALAVWAVGLAGLDMPPEVAAAFAGGIASLFLLVGRRGIRGTLHDLWHGAEG
jgi:hypothetical protein